MVIHSLHESGKKTRGSEGLEGGNGYEISN